MPFISDMNKKQFETSIPEIYTKVIPKYFTERRKADRPVLNGHAVSIEEFKEQYPNYVPEEGFIPDMVYAPPELNVARAFSSVSDIVDMINNDIVFCIFNPLLAYPRIIEILDQYIAELNEVSTGNDELTLYLSKAETASVVLHDYYLRFKNSYSMKAIGEGAVELRKQHTYDMIVKKFRGVGS